MLTRQGPAATPANSADKTQIISFSQIGVAVAVILCVCSRVKAVFFFAALPFSQDSFYFHYRQNPGRSLHLIGLVFVLNLK